MAPQYTVCIILALMIVCFFINKWSYGFIMIGVCALLAATQAVPIDVAFSGFTDPTMIMMAGIFMISLAFGKTSLIPNIQKRVMKLQSGKASILLVLIIIALVALFGQFLPTEGTMGIVIMLIGILGSGGTVTTSRMLFPVALLANYWTSKVPIGMGATANARINAYIEAFDPAYNLGIMDPFKAAIFPLILLSLYTMFAYKMFPNREIDDSKLAVKERKAISKRDEILIYGVFIVVMVGLFLQGALGNIVYVLPVLGAGFLVVTKAFTWQECRQILSGDDIFLIAGSFGIAAALSSTGAGELVGTLILKLLGGNPSELLLMIVFTGIAVVMANLMTRSAIFAVVVPLAVSTAFTAGIDPRPLAVAVAACTYLNAILPSCSSAIGIAIAAGHYNMKEVLKYSIPYLLIGWVATVVDVLIFF